MKNTTSIYAVVAIALAGLASAFFVAQSNDYQKGGREPSSLEAVTANQDNDSSGNGDFDRENTALESSDDGPTELFESIYDRGREYANRAQAASDDTISHFDQDSIARWRPVFLDVNALIDGEYLSEGSVPDTVRISPFPDISYVAIKTNYVISPNNSGAIWSGSIVGSENGTVQITVVGDESDPALVIRIYDYPRSFDIFQSSSPDVYMVLEGNPHRELPNR